MVAADTTVVPTRYRLLGIIRAYCREHDPAPGASRAAHAAWVRALVAVLEEPQKARDMAAQGRQAVLAQFGKQSNIDGLVGTIQTPRLGRN